MKPLRFLSLFAGIGGFDLGLERAGMECVGQVEIDPYCQAVLAKHWPNVKRMSDVREVKGDEFGELDMIVGGDPCQENSNARQGVATTSPSLGHEFIRVVDARRPRLVLRENPSRVRPDAPWPWWRFRAALERIGYVVLPFRFRACCIGADHQRERLFLFAELADPMRPRLEGHEREELERSPRREIRHAAGSHRWSPAPRVCRGRSGIPNRVDRVRILGNAIVPQVAEVIGRAIVQAHAEELEAQG